MPRRNPSQVQPFSVREFFERFPTEESCLEHLMELRHGLRHPCDKCLHLSTFHRLADRPGLYLRALWRERSSDGRDDLSGHPDAAAHVVLCDLPVRHDAARRFAARSYSGSLA